MNICKDACKLPVPTNQSEVDVETESDTDPLPDWLINTEEYEPVLLTREEHSTAEPAENMGQSMKNWWEDWFLYPLMMDLMCSYTI